MNYRSDCTTSSKRSLKVNRKLSGNQLNESHGAVASVQPDKDEESGTKVETRQWHSFPAVPDKDQRRGKKREAVPSSLNRRQSLVLLEPCHASSNLTLLEIKNERRRDEFLIALFYAPPLPRRYFTGCWSSLFVPFSKFITLLFYRGIMHFWKDEGGPRWPLGSNN